MATVKHALRHAWTSLDELNDPDHDYTAMREQHARQVVGASGVLEPDPTLPNAAITQYVLPEIFTVAGTEHKVSRWVNKADKWDRDLGAFSSQAEIEIRRLLREHAHLLLEIDRWRQLLRDTASELGTLLGKEPRSDLKWGFKAALLHAGGHHPTPESAARAVVLAKRGDGVRTVFQLDAAVADPHVRDEVQAALATWRQVPVADQLGAAQEADLWRSTRTMLTDIWTSTTGESEMLRDAWPRLVERARTARFEHDWRSSEMDLSSIKTSPGNRLARVEIGRPGEREADGVLQRSLYTRLHGKFGRGLAERHTGYPEFDVLLRDSAHRSLEPLSLRRPESRAVLLTGHFAVSHISDPMGQKPKVGSPFLRMLGSAIFYRAERARSSGHGPSADDELPDDIEPSNPRSGDLERLELELQRFETSFMEHLWVKLHNLEVDELRDGPVDDTFGTFDSWTSVKKLLRYVANNIGGDAQDASTARIGAIARAVRAASGTQQAQEHHDAELIVAELTATLPYLEDKDTFWDGVGAVMDSKKAVVLTAEDDAELATTLDEVSVAWSTARSQLAAARAKTGIPHPELDLVTILGMVIL